MPVEVLVLGPAPTAEGGSVRDVFAGRASMAADEDEWVDEEDVPAFAGGVGQLPASATPQAQPAQAEAYVLPPPPPMPLASSTSKGARPGKRARGAAPAPVQQQQQQQQQEPKHEQPEIRATRRQPVGRAAGSFGGIVIQEEEEEEEDE
jgi:hypothetical protein